MDFISETKFNAPIKGCLPSTQGNGKGDLRVDSNLQLNGDLCEDGSFIISNGIFVGTEMCNVTIGGFKGCGTDYGLVSGRTANFDNGVFNNILRVGGDKCGNGGVTITGHDGCFNNILRVGGDKYGNGGVTITGHDGCKSKVAGDLAMFGELNVCSATLYSLCSYNKLTVYDEIKFTQSGAGNDDIYWTLFNDNGFLKLSASGACGGCERLCINSKQRGVDIDKLHAGAFDTSDFTLSNERITSWSDLTKYVGGGTETNNKIQRFTSPEVPANCSQFYFEGCNLVTGTELPFIQVRETATGKLVQMDVWVNLDKTCTAYTLGKPVAEVEPCSSEIAAGKWTAIVMN